MLSRQICDFRYNNAMTSTQKSFHQLGTWTFVAILVALVLFPFVRKAAPLERSKWHLAAAANAIAHRDWDKAEEALAAAEKSSKNVRSLPDYWGVYLRLVNGNPARDDSTSTLIEELQEAIAENSDNRLAGNWAVELLSEQGRFDEALATLKLTLGDEGAQDAIQHNQLAYFRALANVELDEALKDIDRSLSEFPGEPSFLDTNAWILHRLGKNEQALAVINSALKELLPNVPADLRQPPADYDPAGLGVVPLGKLPASVSKERFDVIAVIRYHRMKILEALGKDEEALLDYRAIRFWGTEPSDQLY